MNLFKKVSAFLLAGTLIFSLAACSKDDQDGKRTDDPNSPSAGTELALPDDFVVDTSVEDLYLATAGVPGDFPLFTINGQAVPARTYLYWLCDNIAYLQANYALAPDWGADAELTDYVKSDTLNATIYSVLLPEKCAELGFELSEDQRTKLENNLTLTATMMGGEEVFAEELRKAGLTRSLFYDVCATPYYYDLLQNSLFSTPPTEQQILDYAEQNDLLCAKHILLLTQDMTTGEPLPESEITAQKELAETILAQLKTSSNLAADFDALMHQYSQDGGLATSPAGYTFTAGEMVPEFESATRALKVGQVSDIVESVYGYHIILRQSPNSDDARAQYLSSLVSQQLKTWAEQADIVTSEEYDALDPHMFYLKFSAYQQAFAAQSAPETP